MSLHDQLIFGIRRIFSAGVELVNRSALEFVGATVEDDPVNKRTKVTISVPGLPSAVANQLLQHDGVSWKAVSGIDAARITSGGLPAIRGGTGNSGYNTGDLLYASGPITLSARAIGAEGSLFVVSGGLPAWVTGISTDKLTSGTLGYARGGTGQSSWTKGDLLYASAANTLARRGVGSEGEVLKVVSGEPMYGRVAELVDVSVGARLVIVSTDYHEAPVAEDVLAVTADGGYAIRLTNRTGAASIKGSVLLFDNAWRITGETTPGQITAFAPTDPKWDNSDAGRVYFSVSVPGGNATVDIYMDATRTTKVATGALVGNGGGAITLTPVGSPGLNGTVTLAASVVADTTGLATIGSANGVRLHPEATTPGETGEGLAGIMYSDGVPDGSDVWVVVAGKAYVLCPFATPMGAYMLTSDLTGTAAYKAAWEILRTELYAKFGIGRALERTTASGLVLTQLDLRGFQRVLPAS